MTRLQEQADTKMFLYAHHFWCWIWKSQHFYSTSRCGYLGNVLLLHVQWEDSSSIGYIMNNDIAWPVWKFISEFQVFNSSFIQSLPGLHAFSGYDTTSCFERKHFRGCFEARSKFFTKKKKPTPPRSLPPTKDAPNLHI